MTFITFSPVEVIADVLTSITSRDAVKHIIVGPASHEQQQDGVVSLMDAGKGREELYVPLVRPRIQMRVIAPSLAECETIAQHIATAITNVNQRMVGHQASTGENYLVHTIVGSGGPSAHRDTEETWEYLLFAEALMGTVPIP